MKVRFIKNLEYDAAITWSMLAHADPSGNEARAKNMDIDINICEKIAKEGDYSKIKKFVEDYVRQKYSTLNKLFNKTITAYQREWDKIGNSFSERVTEITKVKWLHDTFYVVLSPFHMGISSHGENRVVRSIYEKPENHSRITAHEILMSHIWSILLDRYDNKARDDKYMYFWSVNEISTTAILGLDPLLNKLWSENHKGFDNYLANYPQLQNAKSNLKKLYLSNTSFLDYLNSALNWNLELI